MSDKTVITAADLLAYLGIDYTDEMIETNINRALALAHEELIGAVGENYPVENPLAKELALMYGAQSYETRGLDTTLTGNAAMRANQLALKLRLKMRRDQENEDVR